MPSRPDKGRCSLDNLRSTLMNYDRGIEWTLDDLAERAVDLADNYGSRARACMAVMPANISAYDALNGFSLFAEEMRLADLRGRGWGPWQPSERLTDLENLTVLTAICASGKEIDHLSQLVELTHFAGFLAGPTLTPALTAIVDEIFRS